MKRWAATRLPLHLRDSVVYETRRGIAVQWVPLGEGTIDFKQVLAKVREHCPKLYIYIKPITGRPPQVLPVYDEAFWKLYPKARAADFARFLALAKRGQPYEKNMVVEGPRRASPAALLRRGHTPPAA